MTKLAYSYVRFSTPQQAEGDSLRRQTERAADYCRRRGWSLDTSLKADRGVSAFKGRNALVGNLRAFLDAIKTGAVKPGSSLIVESVDRISRQGIDEGYDLCKQILKSGVHIVTLCPEREYGPEAVKKLANGALELQLILERAAEESEIKATRLGEAWQEKRRTMGERKLTGKGPSWLKLSEDRTRWELRPEVVAVVRRVYQMAIDGHGAHSIAKTFNREAVPGFTSRPWQQSSVGLLLRNRAVLGEFQAHRGCPGNRVPVGDVVKDYYPTIIDENTFYLAQQAMSGRKNKGGPAGEGVANLFSGIVYDARDGKSMVVCRKIPGKGSPLTLVSSGALRGLAGSRYVSFPYPVLEECVLKFLKELAVSDLAPQEDGQKGNDAEAARAKLEGIKAKVKATQDRLLERPDVDALLTMLERLDAERKAAEKELKEAQAKAANAPAEKTLQDYRTLLDLMRATTGEELTALRTKIKAHIRRLVSGVWVLVVPKGRDRLAAVQLWFADEQRCRDYAILYQPKTNGKARAKEEAGTKEEAGKKGQWWPQTLVHDAVPGALDLRQPEHAEKLAEALSAADPEVPAESADGQSVA